MLKMAWNDNDSKIGLAVTGKYGKYYVKENIGNDGNGEVFVVEIIDGRDILPKVYIQQKTSSACPRQKSI